MLMNEKQIDAVVIYKLKQMRIFCIPIVEVIKKMCNICPLLKIDTSLLIVRDI